MGSPVQIVRDRHAQRQRRGGKFRVLAGVTLPVTARRYSPSQEADMERLGSGVALSLDFGAARRRGYRGGLRLATPSGVLRGPDKYRILELKRRRAQIRARRALELG